MRCPAYRFCLNHGMILLFEIGWNQPSVKPIKHHKRKKHGSAGFLVSIFIVIAILEVFPALFSVNEVMAQRSLAQEMTDSLGWFDENCPSLRLAGVGQFIAFIGHRFGVWESGSLEVPEWTESAALFAVHSSARSLLPRSWHRSRPLAPKAPALFLRGKVSLSGNGESP